MDRLTNRLDRLEERAAAWMAGHGMALLRVSMGVIFFWFGVLKFFPSLSPAEDLAGRTISVLTFGLVDPSLSLPVLAAWECAIGLAFMTGRFMRAGVVLLFAQMAGTFLPLVFFPAEAWTRAPYAATLEGQYIIKNLVLVSAGLVLGATVRGYELRPAQAAPAPRPVLPVLASAPVLCAAPASHCRVLPVDAAALPPAVREAFLQIQKDHARA
ncbi:MAG TPA: DoxX family protein [Anaeromyxobacteraceae bacterium]|nr:DoxX family protein [Anaeromyxobacteraceae bacterium]